MKVKTVSILGCGWLGTAFAEFLIGKGFLVKGSATSPEKAEILGRKGIAPYSVFLTPEEAKVGDAEFFKSDVLLIAVPPRRVPDIADIFPEQIRQAVPYIVSGGIKKVIFISSTSVYPENNRVARESDTISPDKESGKALIKAENLLLNNPDFQTIVVRFGGLIGADRNPARFLQKSGPVPNAPVNLIHLADCIGILDAIIQRGVWGATLNACCPVHPTKKEFYEKAAKLSGLPVPEITDEMAAHKIVDSSTLIQLLKYQFIYPSPMDYLDSLPASIS